MSPYSFEQRKRNLVRRHEFFSIACLVWKAMQRKHFVRDLVTCLSIVFLYLQPSSSVCQIVMSKSAGTNFDKSVADFFYATTGGDTEDVSQHEELNIPDNLNAFHVM